MMILHKISMQSADTCVLCCLKEVMVNVQAKNGFEHVGVFECFSVHFVGSCNVHLPWPQSLPKMNIHCTYLIMSSFVILHCTVL